MLRNLGERTNGVHYVAVGMALSRFEAKQRRSAELQQMTNAVEKELFNVEM